MVQHIAAGAAEDRFAGREGFVTEGAEALSDGHVLFPGKVSVFGLRRAPSSQTPLPRGKKRLDFRTGGKTSRRPPPGDADGGGGVRKSNGGADVITL